MKKLVLTILLSVVSGVFGQVEDVRITADGTVINTKTVKFATGKLMVNGVEVIGGPSGVTSVAVSGGNGIGVSGSPITTSGTITLSLGAITPTSVTASGAVSGTNLSGTNTGDQTSIVGISGNLAQFNTALTGAEFATGGGTATGTNTGDQTITLTGDVTGTGTGSFPAIIENDAVTYAKMQNVPTGRVLGRMTTGTGNVEELRVSDFLDFSGAAHGDILFRSAADWQVLTAGGEGRVLMTHGPGSDLVWELPSGNPGFINDTAFGSSWDGDITDASSKNALYDWGHTFDTDDDGKVNVLDQAAGIPLTNASGVLQSPITDNSSNWNTAFTDRLKWDGGATGLVAATGRTSLGLVIGTDVAPIASPTFTGAVTIPTPFTLGAVSVLPTGTELNFVDGVTSSIQTQLDLKAPLASPALTGNPTAPTQTAGDNSTKIATTAYVNTLVPYKVYTALLTQVSNADPTAVVLGTTTIPGTLSWTRQSAGEYRFLSDADPFTDANKIGVIFSGGNVANYKNFNWSRAADGRLDFTFRDDVGNPLDDLLLNATMEIRVYP